MPLLRLVLVAALLAILGTATVRAQANERMPATVAQALKNAGIPLANVAIVVQEAASAKPRLDINGTQPFNPASVMKLLTTYAALDLLGPTYTWKTEAWMTGKLDQGILDGDLWLKGGGDPKLTYEQFWLLLRQIRARGVREIRGDLVLDRTLFELASTNGNGNGNGNGNSGSEDIIDDQPHRPYNVGPDALLLNFKAIHVDLIGDPVRQTLETLIEPQPANLSIINLIKPAINQGNGNCGDWKSGLRVDVTQNGDRLILSGSYPVACGRNTWNLGVMTHPKYVEGVFRQLWQELGGSLRGIRREAMLPANARLLASIDSPTLAEMVRDINKYSNNVMARQLFLTLAAEQNGKPARPLDAVATIQAWLAQKNLRFPELALDNGSGLSRHGRISANSLAQLLASAWKSPLMPEFIASLPLAGVDGTMKKRLKQDGTAGQAHIKTGSLEGVKTIAGYVLDRRGKWQIVVFLVNHPKAAMAQTAQDALLQWVHEQDR